VSEHVRTVKVHVEVDTNKWTYRWDFELEEDEGIEELLERVRAALLSFNGAAL
jgi:hypothetical protein